MAKRRGSAAKTLALLGLPLLVAVLAGLFMVFFADPADFAGDEDTAADQPIAGMDDPAADPEDDLPGEAGSGRERAPKANPATAASVRGVVRLYRTKEPLAGLELRLDPEAGAASYKAVTGKDGAFQFPLVAPGAGYELHGHREPYAPIALTGIDLEPKGVFDVGTLWLDVPVDLDVIVQTLAGAPVEGASVGAFPSGRTAGSGESDPGWGSQRDRRILSLTAQPKPVREALTDADGKAKLTGLLPGTYRIAAWKDGLALSSRNGVVLAPDAEIPPVRILLGTAHALVGSVLDAAGEPLEGATVVAVRGSSWNPGLDKWMAVTDAEGHYALVGLASGRITLFLAREGKPPIQVGSFGVPDTKRFDIHLRPGGTIHGTVTDEEGKPVPDAEVRTAIQNTWSPMSARTDAEGKYRLEDVPAGQLAYFTVQAADHMPHPDPTAPKNASGQSLREGAEMIRDVVLRKGLTASVTVLSERKLALVDAEVQLYLARGGNRPFGARTDGTGKARVTGLIPGTYLVRIRAEGYVQDDMPRWYRQLLTKGPEAIPDAWRLSVGESEGDAEATYQLTRGATVRGKVLDQGGTPVIGAKIDVTGAQSEFPVFTDGDGTFAVEAVAASGRAVATASIADQPGGASDPFIVPAGGEVNDVEIQLGEGATLSGSVRSQSGEPLTGAFVRWLPGRISGNWAFQRFERAPKWPVDAQGRFHITGVSAPEGQPVTVRADADGVRAAWDNQIQVTPGQETGGIELILPPSLTIEGRVESQAGAGVPGAMVSLSSRNRNFVAGVGGMPTAQTDADGKFVLEGVSEGKFRIWAQAAEFASGTRVDAQGGADDVLITLAPGLTISGVVKDTEGNPVTGMPVSARKTDRRDDNWWWWGGSQAYTAPDGTFEMRGMAEGVYTLSVSARWQWGREVNAQDTTLAGVRAGRDDVEIVIEAGKIIEGRVVDNHEKPVTTGWVNANFEGSNNRNNWRDQRYATVRADGTFRIVGLKPGPYTLGVSGSFQYAIQKGVAAGSRDVEIVVEEALSIEGRVVDESGIGIGGGLSIRARAAGTDDWEWKNRFTPGDGVFIILALDAGAWDLEIRPNGMPPIVIPNVTAGTRDLTVTATEGVVMSGQVVDGSGKPIKSARVRASQIKVASGKTPANRSGRTDELGHFEIEGLATGEYSVIVTARGYAMGVYGPIQGNDSNAKFTIEVGQTVSGQVVDGSGNELPSTRMWLKNPEGTTVSSTNSANDGTFNFDNVPSGGSWTLELGRWENGEYRRHVHSGKVNSGAADLKITWP